MAVPLATCAGDSLVYPPVPGLETSECYTVCARPVGGEWRSAFAWETACKAVRKKEDTYFDTLAGRIHADASFESDGIPRPVVPIIAEATGEILCTVRAAGESFTPRVYAQGKYTVNAVKDKPDTVVTKGVEVG
jgi:hypothetical protein